MRNLGAGTAETRDCFERDINKVGPEPTRLNHETNSPQIKNTVCPVKSNRFLHLMSRHATMLSTRTMYDRAFLKFSRSRSFAPPGTCPFFVRTIQRTGYEFSV